MVVIVAEKHNQGEDIASALMAPGSIRKGEACFYGHLKDENRPAVVVFCEGHLLEPVPPEVYDPKWGKWNLATLPVRPPDLAFRYEPRGANAKRLLSSIRQQCEKADEIVNGCDAGREGELIFWEVMRLLGFPHQKQVVRRLWIQNPTPGGIQSAFLKRKMGEDDTYRRMRDVALLRQHADWIYGINCSRYVTLCMPPHESYRNATYAIGRVMTPVLGMIYDATEKSRAFTEQPFYRVRLVFRGKQESFQALVIAPEEHRYGKIDTMFTDPIISQQFAYDIAIYAVKWEAFDEVKEAEEFPPEPFSLVELQRTAFRLFRWPAAYTLKVAQHCYSADKTLTYPRTASSHLPESMRPSVENLHAELWQEYIVKNFKPSEELVLPGFHHRYFRPDEDMEDHHAIIPTGRIPPRHDGSGKISDAFILWDLVVRRFIMSIYEPAKVNACSRVLTFEHPTKPEIHFRALLKAAPIVKPSWLAVEESIGNCRGYGKRLRDRLDEKFPESEEIAECIKVQRVKGYTDRPPEYDDDTLMGLMQKLKLGTPATRAEFIERLVERDYIERRPSGFLCPRGLGAHLVQELNRMTASELLSPDLTARWEKQFDELEERDLTAKERIEFLERAVVTAEGIGKKLMGGNTGEQIVYCPMTHKRVREDDFQYYFDGYTDVIFKKIHIGRNMLAADWRDILVANPRKGAGPFDGFKGKSGPFTSRIGFSPKRGKWGHFKLMRDFSGD